MSYLATGRGLLLHLRLHQSSGNSVDVTKSLTVRDSTVPARVQKEDWTFLSWYVQPATEARSIVSRQECGRVVRPCILNSETIQNGRVRAHLWKAAVDAESEAFGSFNAAKKEAPSAISLVRRSLAALNDLIVRGTFTTSFAGLGCESLVHRRAQGFLIVYSTETLLCSEKKIRMRYTVSFLQYVVSLFLQWIICSGEGNHGKCSVIVLLF